MKRLLLVGAAGQLGTEIRRQAEGQFELRAATRAELDLCRADDLAAAVAAWRPATVINAAAFHVPEQCETRFGEALRVNCVAVRDAAAVCREHGAGFLTVSTDYVFPGDRCTPYAEDDATRPLQAYGISKQAGECAALGAHPEGTIVVRSCGVYGKAGSKSRAGNFVDKRLRDAAAGDSVEVGSDLVCTPTSAADLAGAILALLAQDRPEAGVYHLTNEGECSWAEFTAVIYRLSGLATRVVPVDRKGAYGIVRRPPYSVLANRRAAARGIRLPDWRDALARYLRDA